MTKDKQQDKFHKFSEPDNNGWVTESHPSYGVIGIGRVSGQATLFDSSVQHLHFIKLEISEAERVHDRTRSFISGGKRLIEVWMSEAQFAQMITQPNQGEGAPCTIRYCQGDPTFEKGKPYRPEPPNPEPVLDKFKLDLDHKAAEIRSSAGNAVKLVEDMLSGEEKTNKTTLREVKERLDSVINAVQHYLPYLVKEVDETMENRTSEAKVEFETYVSQSLQARGLEHLKSEAPRLVVGDSPKLTAPVETVEKKEGEK